MDLPTKMQCMLLHEHLKLLLSNIGIIECLASSQLHADCSMTPSLRADVAVQLKAAMSSLKGLQTSPWHEASTGIIRNKQKCSDALVQQCAVVM